MFETETTVSWMMRGIDEHSSLLFAVPVTVEEDEPGLFGAVVKGMEDLMAASGRTPEEASENARLLFMATVDDALARKISVQFVTGLPAVTVNVPISKAPQLFALLESEMTKREGQHQASWLRIAPQAVTEHHTG
jgi:hypothetical protein